MIGMLLLAAPLWAQPGAAPPRTDGPPDFFTAVGLTRPAGPPASDLWHIADSSTTSDPVPIPDNAFHLLLVRMSVGEELALPSVASGPGLTADFGRVRFKNELAGDFYRHTSSLEIPDIDEFESPYGKRNWSASENLQIPVPISVPLAEQLFVYGQFNGSGNALTPEQTSLSTKSGIGVKWAPIAGSELQVRYATVTSYADMAPGRVQPALEVLAKLPLVGPLALHYSGSALPAVTRTETDQFRQELRFAYPFKGGDEIEFGARYRWDLAPNQTPWPDRAQLFFGLRLKH